MFMFSDNSFLLITNQDNLFASNILSFVHFLVVHKPTVSVSKLSPLRIHTLEAFDINLGWSDESDRSVSSDTCYDVVAAE